MAFVGQQFGHVGPLMRLSDQQCTQTLKNVQLFSLKKIPMRDFSPRDVGYTEASDVTVDVTSWALRENDVIDNRKVAVSITGQAVWADF
ncbi:hypothetical protein [Serratia ficaria]|uniref:hypothetical protein n=1 Tax=Serratia ficaria TaxID=61651 RepID=UPI0021C67303|nr:hypothetical protein [Serratia ficaria]